MYLLPYDIWMYILDFVIPPPKMLLDWIDPENIDWWYLSQNTAAIELLRANPEKIDWDNLSRNPRCY